MCCPLLWLLAGRWSNYQPRGPQHCAAALPLSDLAYLDFSPCAANPAPQTVITVGNWLSTMRHEGLVNGGYQMAPVGCFIVAVMGGCATGWVWPAPAAGRQAGSAQAAHNAGLQTDMLERR